ncbi:hypothetical protein BCV69DRAFT_211746 [Microstroma glucosiphilum]|uniref:Uncharacterized protein n=1 Tax=Pseudomicrostroma glucosiphilum TaxID=1684307 RepID=A0A316U6R2_9BASI|nr:hypothetical protein BCV69DRAFT_211746 [Pseudomicrostroma glucosiphilum]PWN20514.1 hypothetical protein BCV69DRAFT_211746 [Pseudomicrostroma glucosiphilum]
MRLGRRTSNAIASGLSPAVEASRAGCHAEQLALNSGFLIPYPRQRLTRCSQFHLLALILVSVLVRGFAVGKRSPLGNGAGPGTRCLSSSAGSSTSTDIDHENATSVCLVCGVHLLLVLWDMRVRRCKWNTVMRLCMPLLDVVALQPRYWWDDRHPQPSSLAAIMNEWQAMTISTPQSFERVGCQICFSPRVLAITMLLADAANLTS